MERSERYWIDAGLVGVWGLLAVLVVTLPVVRESPVRALVAGSFLLFAPGYALVAALFVREGQLSVLERLVFSVGASVAVVGLVGVLLAQVPALGVGLVTVLAAQLSLVVVLFGAAVSRRRRLDPKFRVQPGASLLTLGSRAWSERSTVGGGSRVVQFAIVVAVLAAIGSTVFVVATPLPSEQYTEFYVMGSDGTAEAIPETVAENGTIDLLVGVANNEHRTVDYGLQVQVHGADSSVVATDRWTLQHGASNEQELTVEPTAQDEFVVELLLFEGPPPGEVVDPASAYRHTSVTVQIE